MDGIPHGNEITKEGKEEQHMLVIHLDYAALDAVMIISLEEHLAFIRLKHAIYIFVQLREFNESRRRLHICYRQKQ